MLSAAVVIGALRVKGHFGSSVPANEKLQDIKSKPKNSAQMVSTVLAFTILPVHLIFTAIVFSMLAVVSAPIQC